ncbi:amidohydrolase [Paenibacillus pasadenensis]|uniref:amidohydrolase n=1 Tax=Paenibacillus pasadenensis TaxID=217090 RepID=UPI0020408003|nr:amidohydrolase [Paenibacillus pasadenensis]MCM3749811.1 amidohydrolase [Paenibacillus pasadenensis]
MNGAYWLTNVKLETGYEVEENNVTGTLTELFHIRIGDGKIQEIEAGSAVIADELPQYDAKGLLLLPSFKDAHIHLDKTFYGGPWKAVRPARTIFDRLQQERELLPELISVSRERAEKLLELLLSHGSTHVRSHVNIDPVSGLRLLEATKAALSSYEGKVTAELVAFPQHGLLLSDSAASVKEAVLNGADFVGSVDPATIDGDIERSLQKLFDIAVETGAGVDLHVHDSGEAGLNTLKRVADLTDGAGWQGRVTVSHAFAFAANPQEEIQALSQRFGKLGISVASALPIGKLHMPIPMLTADGVRVELGTDSVTDHWSPFGNGDNLEKVGRLAELYGRSNELGLSQSLQYITRGITPLDAQGNQVWPAAGDEASIVLVKASCSAEAVARRAERVAVIHKGTLAWGTI